MDNNELSTNLASLGTDCISRQAAIDLLKQMRKDGDMVPWEGKNVFARIRELPTISIQPEIIRCKDCKHFEYDHVANINGIPLIVAHEICTRWGDGVKTSENGYCFLAERREVTT